MLIERLLPRAKRGIENPAVPLSRLAEDDVWEEVFGESTNSDAGERVDARKALTFSPVAQAVRMISGDCSKLPLKVFRRRPGGRGKDEDLRHPASRLIERDSKANDEIPALQLWRAHFAAALIFENSFIWIERTPAGVPVALYNLLPDRTAPVRHRGRLFFVTEVDGELEPLPADDVLWLRGLCFDGQDAPQLVKQFRQDIGEALARRKFTSKFFANGLHAGGVLQLPPGTKKPARDRVEKSLQSQRRAGSDNAFKSIVLRDGYRFFPTMVDPEKAQLIELDDQEVRHVARWFNLAPSFLGVSDSISYNSEEQKRRSYHDTTLSYWLTANQAECSAKLLTPRQQERRTHVVRYQINALLWADTKTRSEIANAGIERGRFSPDETREWEGLNPRDDGEGDRFYRPANLVVAGSDPTASARRMRSALEQLLRETLRRCGRRLEVRRERSRRRGGDWQSEKTAELDPLAEMLAAPLAAARAAGLTDRQPNQLAEELLARNAERLEDELPDQLHTLLSQETKDGQDQTDN